jgi:hypothetical protein
MISNTKVDPSLVSLDQDGFYTQRWFVRLPRGMVADDLKDPEIWSHVTGRQDKPIRKHDYIYIVGNSEEFAVEARVTNASLAGLVLALVKVIHYPERLTPLFSDDSYRVVWATSGYIVERIADGFQVGGPFGSEGLAIRHLQSLYPALAS